MVLYKVNKSDNPNYWMYLVCAGHNFELLADLPEQIGIGISSDWESRLPYSLAGLLEKAFGSVVTKVSDATGYAPQVQALSFQMWMGTSPIEIPITVLFDAEESAQRDVFEPISYLESLILPVNGRGGLLWPPGPVWGGGNSRGYGIDIHLGRMMLFKDCILASANKTFDTQLDDFGFPIRGQIEMTFRTSIVYGHSDYINAMQLVGISEVEKADGSALATGGDAPDDGG